MSALMPTIVPVTEAKAKLAELIGLSDTEDVVVTQRGRAAAVLVSASRYSEMLDRIETLEDSLEIADAKLHREPTVPLSQVVSDLGL
ncbi:MAG: type II toxin-antitoxin system Phd/YefM family antitoxin [Propionibacteriaceae bacterium]|jgi:prevent-host-death family protein|nr:type II toxin-antitoxin system Phd/YefM family antitoxin [Propionibacteriaceae bacterium]